MLMMFASSATEALTCLESEARVSPRTEFAASLSTAPVVASVAVVWRLRWTVCCSFEASSPEALSTTMLAVAS